MTWSVPEPATGWADAVRNSRLASPGDDADLAAIGTIAALFRDHHGELVRLALFTIPDISWTADGRSIVFLGLWCNFPPATNLCAGTSGPQGYRATQVRSPGRCLAWNTARTPLDSNRAATRSPRIPAGGTCCWWEAD